MKSSSYKVSRQRRHTIWLRRTRSTLPSITGCIVWLPLGGQLFLGDPLSFTVSPSRWDFTQRSYACADHGLHRAGAPRHSLETEPPKENEMAHSSILGGDAAVQRPIGNDVDALGPSDTSDSGSDVQGERPMATGADNPAEWGAVTAAPGSDTDASGTGERATAPGDGVRDNADILPDRIIDPSSEDSDADAMREVNDIEGADSDDEAIEGTGAD
jgi:hypothetical protein